MSAAAGSTRPTPTRAMDRRGPSCVVDRDLWGRQGEAGERPGKGAGPGHHEKRLQRLLIGPAFEEEQTGRVLDVLEHRVGQAAWLYPREAHVFEAERDG